MRTSHMSSNQARLKWRQVSVFGYLTKVLGADAEGEPGGGYIEGRAVSKK